MISDSPFQVVFAAKPSPIRWNIFSSCRASAMVIRGGKRLLTGYSAALMADEDAQAFGWEAPTYGELQPGISLLWRRVAGCTTTCRARESLRKPSGGTTRLISRRTRLGGPHGTMKSRVLSETIVAAFEMDEILYVLKDHIVGLNCGRWDYIFSSFIKKVQKSSLSSTSRALPGNHGQGFLA